MSTVMIVEDDASLRRALAAALRSQGYDIVETGTAETALQRAARSMPDLVLLDLALPRADGFHALQKLRTMTGNPIIIISVRDEKDDKITALDMGADDYVVKPFDGDELLARVRASLRRRSSTGLEAPVAVRALDLEIDFARGAVTRAGTVTRLTPTELRFLELLVRSDGRLLRHQEVAAHLAEGGERPDPQTLRVYVAQLRRKLGDDAGSPRLIFTHHGLGYRWIADE